VNNPIIYNVEEDNGLSPGLQQVVTPVNSRLQSGLQPLITGSVLKILFFCQFGSVIVFTISKIILFSSTKQNIKG